MLIGAAVAPLVWVERVRGRRRIALLGLYALIGAAIGLLAWRSSRLSGLPDIGDPFDPAPVLAIDVPEDRNAFTFWRRASARVRRDAAIEKRLFKSPYAWPKPSDAEALGFLAGNAEALELWRKGSERTDAMVIRPADVRLETDFGTLINDHRDLARMALTTASGCMARGDMEGTWAWYRAGLRSSRLLGRNGTLILFLVGTAEYGMTSAAVQVWADDPSVDVALLRRALGDVIADHALTAPISSALRIDYLEERHALDDPSRLFQEFVMDRTGGNPGDRASWINHITPLHHVAWFLGNEPARTRRLHRLAYANWLADCDAPRGDRPGIVASADGKSEFYDRPWERSAGGVSGAELARRVGETRLAPFYISGGIAAQRAFDRDRGLRAGLEIALATAIYEREHGRPLVSVDSLVGPYLERLPEGYVAPPPPTPEP